MPRGDRTGPEGRGSMTGRAAGYCTGNPVPGFMNPRDIRSAPGAMRGNGKGGAARSGRGHRNWYNATGLPGWSRYNMGYPAWGSIPTEAAPQEPSNKDTHEEVDMLRGQSEYLEEQLGVINKRLQELENDVKENTKKEE